MVPPEDEFSLLAIRTLFRHNSVSIRDMASDFYQKVYEVVAMIPQGKVTTYGAIAKYLGVASGARMVGYALNQLIHENEDQPLPAHRVVNRLGQLTGRAWFPGDAMRERLEQEGVQFTGEYTVDISEHFWDPCSDA